MHINSRWASLAHSKSRLPKSGGRGLLDLLYVRCTTPQKAPPTDVDSQLARGFLGLPPFEEKLH
jgi:hypothetical protein